MKKPKKDSTTSREEPFKKGSRNPIILINNPMSQDEIEAFKRKEEIRKKLKKL